MAGNAGASTRVATGLVNQGPSLPAIPAIPPGGLSPAPGTFTPNPVYAPAFGPAQGGYDPYQAAFMQQQQQALSAQQFLQGNLPSGYGGIAGAAGQQMLNQGLGQDQAAQAQALGAFLTQQETAAEQLATQGVSSDQVKAMLQARAEAFGVPLPQGAFSFLDSLYQGQQVSPLANTGLPSQYQDAIKNYTGTLIAQNPKMKPADAISQVMTFLQNNGVTGVTTEAYRPEIEKLVNEAIGTAPPAPMPTPGLAGPLAQLLGQVPGLQGATPSATPTSLDAGLSNLPVPAGYTPFGPPVGSLGPTNPTGGGPTFIGPRP